MQWTIIPRSSSPAVIFLTLVVCRAANKACDKKKEIRTVCRETCLTIHLHQPTQCPHFTEEFLIWCRKVPRMVTRCKPVRTSCLTVTWETPICKFDGSVFAETSTERLVAEGEEHNKDTIPTPRFAQRLSTGNFNSPPEGVYPPTEYLCRMNSGKTVAAETNYFEKVEN